MGGGIIYSSMYKEKGWVLGVGSKQNTMGGCSSPGKQKGFIVSHSTTQYQRPCWFIGMDRQGHTWKERVTFRSSALMFDSSRGYNYFGKRREMKACVLLVFVVLLGKGSQVGRYARKGEGKRKLMNGLSHSTLFTARLSPGPPAFFCLLSALCLGFTKTCCTCSGEGRGGGIRLLWRPAHH